MQKTPAPTARRNREFMSRILNRAGSGRVRQAALLLLLALSCAFLITAQAVTIEVKDWSPDTGILGGELTSAIPAKVAPGGSFSCSVNTATDSDHWVKRRLNDTVVQSEGDEEDTVHYEWSGGEQGTFADATAASTAWTAPTAVGTYTLSCSVDDGPGAVVPPETGDRDDDPLPMVQITVDVRGDDPDDPDNDGIPNATDPDDDNDGTPDATDTDDDNNGIADDQEAGDDGDDDDDPPPNNDIDGDGIPNAQDPDHPAYDQDGDGIPNIIDTDDDNNGVPDDQEGGNDDPPCGTWHHDHWAAGQVTWTADGDGYPQPSITDATETCAWSDACANTTQAPVTHARAYTVQSDEVVTEADGKKYRKISYVAHSGCGGPDSVVSSQHVLPDDVVPKVWDSGTPISASMTAPAADTKVAPGSAVTFTVNANDSDDWKQGTQEGTDLDSLNYQWSGGSFSGSGASVSWTPPDVTGTYTITCVVDDEPKAIAPDKGARGDGPVTVSVTVVVPPRTWTPGTGIGTVLDGKTGKQAVTKEGVPVVNGRLVSPQDQTKPLPVGVTEYPTIKVRPGEELSCTVEGASDWDHWKREGFTEGNEGEYTDQYYGLTHGDGQDEVKYMWSGSASNQNQFKGDKTTGPSVTWVAPEVDHAAGATNEYTVVCTIDDKPAEVTTPDLPVGMTGRNDGVVERKFKVKVVDETSWMGLSLYRNQGDASPAVGPIGGTAWIAVDVQVGGQTTFAAPGAIRLRVQEHDGEGLHDETDNHAWLDVSEASWVEWDFDAPNGGQNAHWKTEEINLPRTNSQTTPRRFRKWVEWNTTAEKNSADPDGADAVTGGPLKAGKLWGHNASHTVELEYSVKPGDDWLVKHQAEFQPDDGGDVKQAGPARIGANVGNLVFGEVAVGKKVNTNMNEDYFIFDPGSSEPARQQPEFKFKIEDAGDKHQYRWWVYIEPTTQTEPVQSYAYLTGIATDPGTITATWNGRSGDASEGQPLAARGTYTFDIYIDEVADATDVNAPSIDETVLTSEYLYMAEHDFVFHDTALDTVDESDDEDAPVVARIEYKLDDIVGKDATSVTAKLLDHDFIEKAVHNGGTQDKHSYGDIDLYELSENDEEGTWRTIFSAIDSHSGAYRDHKNRRMWVVNRPGIAQFLYVMIDPGHGRFLHDDGSLGWRREKQDAISRDPNATEIDRLHEDDGTLAFARALQERLGTGRNNRAKFRMRLTRSNVDDLHSNAVTANTRRHQRADEWFTELDNTRSGFDILYSRIPHVILFSIHTNAGPSTGHGTETYLNPHRPNAVAASTELAQKVHNRMISLAKRRDRMPSGVTRHPKNLTIFQGTNDHIPCALAEVLFHTNTNANTTPPPHDGIAEYDLLRESLTWTNGMAATGGTVTYAKNPAPPFGFPPGWWGYNTGARAMEYGIRDYWAVRKSPP
jgi:N-acetylmuramoyl-L-alanine amidase